MNLAMANEFGAVGFTELNEKEKMCLAGGDLMAAIGIGLFTVIGTVGCAVLAPPGTKIKAASSVAVAGTFLTLDAYQW